jgi:hypothetical protein
MLPGGAAVRTTGVHEVLPGWTAQDRGDTAPTLTYVQVARGLTFDGATLELLDLAPVTVCVAPAPGCSLAHVTTGAFLDLWWATDDPAVGERWRRGVVSLVDPEHRPSLDALVRLRRPRIHGSGLRYDVELVEGVLPPSSGSCVLFVHPATDASTTAEAPA